MKAVVFIILFILFNPVLEEEISFSSFDGLDIYGTLLQPENKSNHAILIISGSGQTDRDGNTPSAGVVNDGLKKLAEELTKQGYATLRYDKRGVGKSINTSLTPENLRFEHLIKDAEVLIEYLSDNYEKVTVIGHSQGALVGMIALQEAESFQFISLAGMAQDAYITIRQQLANQQDFVKNIAYPILDSLKAGVKVDSVPFYLNNLFNPRIQDYFISFMKYDPQNEIGKLDIPILIIQGDNDLQIKVSDTEEMGSKNKKAKVVIIEGMNHILRDAPTEPGKNIATYNEKDLPLHPDLIPVLVRFLN